MDLKPTIIIPPFKKFCMTIGNLPSSYVESMTYLEMVMWLCNYLEKTIIPTVNNNGEAVTELQTLFTQLKNYVDNYFNNLDVQEEINHKLDKMAQSGELADIISQYLNSKAIFMYDTLNDMLQAENLTNGITAQTLGYTDKYDNCGALYSIRNRILTDTERQGMHLIGDTLTAELMIDNSKVNYIFPNDFGDVTSADCSLIKAFGKNIMIDTFATHSYNKVVNMLINNNISHLDYVIISHYHVDHVGNLNNLINSGYIDTNTIVYLPPLCDLMNNNNKQTAQDTESLLLSLGITYIIPEEQSKLLIGESFSITFYNCNPNILNNSGWTDYNNASMMCFVVHGNKKMLYTGDNYRLPINRLFEEGFITEKLDFYKIEHHAIEYTQDHTPFLALYNWCPDYAYSPTGKSDWLLNKISNSITLNILKNINTKTFAMFNNEDYVIFESTIDTFNNIKGKQSQSLANNFSSYTLYVDPNTTNTKYLGTQEYPFNDLMQAVSFAYNMPLGTINIHLADGTYNLGNNYKYVPRFSGKKIVISGNTENNTAVIIDNGLIFTGCDVVINYCTINSRITYGITSSDSNITLNHCIIKSTNETLQHYNNGLNTTRCKIYCIFCEFTNLNLAINSTEDLLYLSNCNIHDINSGVYLVHTLLFNHFTSISNYSNYDLNYEKGDVHSTPKRLYQGTAHATDITLSDDITNYNKLVVQSGVVGKNTIYTDLVFSFSDLRFALGSTYKVRTATNDIITLAIDSENPRKITVSGTTDNVTPLRSIWASLENRY